MNTINILITIACLLLLTASVFYINQSLLIKRRELKKLIRKDYIITAPKKFKHWLESKSITELNDEFDRFKQISPSLQGLSSFIRKKQA